MKEAVIISKNLKDLEFGEVVKVVPKNMKILGNTVKQVLKMSVDEIAVIKNNHNELDTDINIYVVNKNDMKTR